MNQEDTTKSDASEWSHLSLTLLLVVYFTLNRTRAAGEQEEFARPEAVTGI